MDNILVAVFGLIALLVAGGTSFFASKKSNKKKVEGGKKIGESEARDEVREDVIEKADDQINKNKELSERARKALKKSRELRNEKNTD